MFDTDYSEKKFLAMKEYNFKKTLQERDTIIAEKDKEIARLKEQLAQKDKL